MDVFGSLWSNREEPQGNFLGGVGEHQGLGGWWEGPWCLGGDFNEILSPSERARGGNFTPPMRCFAEIINELGLRDLPLQGGLFTWSGV